MAYNITDWPWDDMMTRCKCRASTAALAASGSLKFTRANLVAPKMDTSWTHHGYNGYKLNTNGDINQPQMESNGYNGI